MNHLGKKFQNFLAVVKGAEKEDLGNRCYQHPPFWKIARYIHFLSGKPLSWIVSGIELRIISTNNEENTGLSQKKL